MNFQSKDFLYVKKAFGEFIDQAEDGARLYLRSLSTQNPAQLPADIQHDFPSIAGDFQVPPELAMILETFHSSPLRISGVSKSCFEHYPRKHKFKSQYLSKDIYTFNHAMCSKLAQKLTYSMKPVIMWLHYDVRHPMPLSTIRLTDTGNGKCLMSNPGIETPHIISSWRH